VTDPNSLDRANQDLGAAIAADQQANGSLHAVQQQVGQLSAQLSQEQQTFANLQATQNALLSQVNLGNANDRFRTAASLNNVTGAMQASQDRIAHLSADLVPAEQNLQACAAQAAQADQAVASAQQTRDQIAAAFAAAEGQPLYNVPPATVACPPTVVYAQPVQPVTVVAEPFFGVQFGLGRGPIFIGHDRFDHREGGHR
jgi:septal ring factor EnvC (AmiA/AmiB activator)